MPQMLEAVGLVLNRAPAGERHLRLTLLTPTLGLITGLMRESRPAGAKKAPSPRAKQPPPQQADIFDHAELRLQAPEAGSAHAHVYFLREYKVLRRHAGLGRNYAALAAAAGLSTFLAHNARHFESCANVFDLCRHALAALDDGAPPAAVHLKALCLLANAEGYAVREQWLPTLSEVDQALVLAVITRPAAEAAALAAGDSGRLPKLRSSFERWLNEHTDLEAK